ncbi:MAG: hypothetical protein LBP76_12190 [Treponema sp.]|jgi:hypothetical protein|nr:hypothetical protein [Treponema sp.]
MFKNIEFNWSAFRHHISEEDIRWAFFHYHMSVSTATHKTPTEIISEMVHERATVSAP